MTRINTQNHGQENDHPNPDKSDHQTANAGFLNDAGGKYAGCC